MTTRIRKADRGFELVNQITLPMRRDELFPFFADARNLERITPPQLRFEILTPPPIEMREGLLIDYRLSMRGVPIRWQSEISAWDPPYRFIDRQRRGPYRWWVHEHLFEERDGATIVRDEVSYGVPGGAMVNALFVQRELQRIFDYRSRTLRYLFGGRETGSGEGVRQ